MEANQFVLMCAVFIIVAAYMVSIPPIGQEPIPLPAASLICRFDTFCSGAPCVKRAAPQIRISAPAEDGWTLVSRTDSPYEFMRLARQISDSAITYRSLQRPEQGETVLTVSGSGAMQFEQTDQNGVQIAAGEGYCREPDATGAAMTNGDKV